MLHCFGGALFTRSDPGVLAGFVEWLPLFMFCPQVFLPVSLEAMMQVQILDKLF
jgi:hypothetical protein